jgi:ABC-type glutathione transport system ATPase component
METGSAIRTMSPSKRNRHLLNDVSGFVALGKITAFMGESGAGKVHKCRTYMAELSSYGFCRPTLSRDDASQAQIASL